MAQSMEYKTGMKEKIPSEDDLTREDWQQNDFWDHFISAVKWKGNRIEGQASNMN